MSIYFRDFFAVNDFSVEGCEVEKKKSTVNNTWRLLSLHHITLLTKIVESSILIAWQRCCCKSHQVVCAICLFEHRFYYFHLSVSIPFYGINGSKFSHLSSIISGRNLNNNARWCFAYINIKHSFHWRQFIYVYLLIFLKFISKEIKLQIRQSS